MSVYPRNQRISNKTNRCTYYLGCRCEPYADEIDWDTARVQEKIDGKACEEFYLGADPLGRGTGNRKPSAINPKSENDPQITPITQIFRGRAKHISLAFEDEGRFGCGFANP
jgi:hypothetical protein